MYIAWRAHEAVDNNNDILMRYFSTGDILFVRQVFKGMFEPEMWGPSPLFSKLTIYHGPARIGVWTVAQAGQTDWHISPPGTMIRMAKSTSFSVLEPCPLRTPKTSIAVAFPITLTSHS